MARTVATLVAALAVAGTATVAVDAQMSYSDLVRIPPAERERALATLTPENRAVVTRQHLERWLTVHRPDLSSHAQTLVREVIDLTTPALWTAPRGPALEQRQSLVAQQLGCALGSERAGTLMKVGSEPQRTDQSLGDRAREWIDWLVNCAGR